MAIRKHLSHPEIVRQRIQTSQIVNRLTDHVNGAVELTATQVTAALGLLRKSLPDLTAISHSGAVELKRPNELTDDELAAIATGSSSGVAEAADGEEIPGGVH